MAQVDLKPVDDFISPAETKYYESPGVCIYCSEPNGLTKEHVIPYWMAGAYVIRAASCGKCALVTGRFEGNLSDTTFLALRKRIKVQSRSKNLKKSPKFEITVIENGLKFTKIVSEHELPPLFPCLYFPPPGIIEGHPPLFNLKPDSLSYRVTIANIANKINTSRAINGKFKTAVNPANLIRLAAKIAHGFLYLTGLYKEYDPLLVGSILTGHYVSYFVGCPPVDDALPVKPNLSLAPNEQSLHLIKLESKKIAGDNSYIYILSTIHLFCDFGGPIFEVVTARKKIHQDVHGASIACYIPIGYGKEGKFDSCNLWLEATLNKG